MQQVMSRLHVKNRCFPLSPPGRAPSPTSTMQSSSRERRKKRALFIRTRKLDFHFILSLPHSRSGFLHIVVVVEFANVLPALSSACRLLARFCYLLVQLCDLLKGTNDIPLSKGCFQLLWVTMATRKISRNCTKRTRESSCESLIGKYILNIDLLSKISRYVLYALICIKPKYDCVYPA